MGKYYVISTTKYRRVRSVYHSNNDIDLSSAVRSKQAYLFGRIIVNKTIASLEANFVFLDARMLIKIE